MKCITLNYSIYYRSYYDKTYQYHYKNSNEQQNINTIKENPEHGHDNNIVNNFVLYRRKYFTYLEKTLFSTR